MMSVITMLIGLTWSVIHVDCSRPMECGRELSKHSARDKRLLFCVNAYMDPQTRELIPVHDPFRSPQIQRYEFGFTWNDIPDGETTTHIWDTFRSQCEEAVERGQLRAICGQLERAPETKHLHGQCYVRFGRRRTFPRREGVVPVLSDYRVSFQGRKPTQTVEAMLDYCTRSTSKDGRIKRAPDYPGSAFQYGDFGAGRAEGQPKKGQRTDLDDLAQAVRGGGPFSGHHPYRFLWILLFAAIRFNDAEAH